MQNTKFTKDLSLIGYETTCLPEPKKEEFYPERKTEVIF